MILGPSLTDENLQLAKQLGVDEVVGITTNIPPITS
jgi:hypothetical protein